MPKTPVSLKLSAETLRLVEALKKFYETRTAAVEAGIRDLATRHKIK
jgi:hypothetical protein